MKTWGGSNYEEGRAVALDSGGNIYVVGSTSSFGPGSPSQGAVFLLKYNATYDLQWQKIWSGPGNGTDYGFALAIDRSGNIIVAGTTYSFGDHGASLLLLRFDASGDLLWQRIWSPYGGAFGYGIAVDLSSSIYVTGWISGSPGCCQYFVLLKFDPSGSLVWQRSWSASSVGYGVEVGPSGSVYVVGYQAGGSAGGNDLLLLKFASNGTLVWQRDWGGSLNDVGFALAIDPSENVYITGDTYSFGAGDDDALLLKFNSTGSLLWQRTWGGSNYDEGYGVAVNSAGNVWVAGLTISFGGGEKVFLLNVDPSGNLLSQATWGGSGNDWAWGLALDSTGNPIVTGYVSEAPPYALGTGNATLGVPMFASTNPGISLGTPTISSHIPNGDVGAPSGSENYSGLSDTFLLSFGTPKHTLLFQTNNGLGSIYFSGNFLSPQDFKNEQSYNVAKGHYSAAAIVPAGYLFAGWTSTANITLSSTTANPTNVTVNGDGNLKANFTNAVLTSLYPSGMMLPSLIAAVTLLWWKRRRRVFGQ